MVKGEEEKEGEGEKTVQTRWGEVEGWGEGDRRWEAGGPSLPRWP